MIGAPPLEDGAVKPDGGLLSPSGRAHGRRGARHGRGPVMQLEGVEGGPVPAAFVTVTGEGVAVTVGESGYRDRAGSAQAGLAAVGQHGAVGRVHGIGGDPDPLRPRMGARTSQWPGRLQRSR